MTEDEIQDAARLLGVTLDAWQAGALLRFRDLLVAANQRFNLTALTDDASILRCTSSIRSPRFRLFATSSATSALRWS